MTMGAHTPERRAHAWLDDASYDLGEAYKLFNAESYSWACFIASTAAEKALKALIYRFENDPQDMMHHRIIDYYTRLLPAIPELAEVEEQVFTFRQYDSFVRYIVDTDLSAARSRYAKPQAEQALAASEQILQAARSIVAKASEILS